jgi:D-arabinose 1-dehydrogenase-like Zn-dependent alcohol dehydrogenase
MGHSVSAFSHSPTKMELIQQLGATYIDSSHLAELTTLRRKFDFILSTLNTKFDLDAYLGMLRPQGKLCFVAQPLEKMSVSVGMLYDNAQRTLYGSYVGSREAMMAMLAFAEEHRIESIVDVMPFDKVNEAIDRVRSGKVPMRLVLQR